MHTCIYTYKGPYMYICTFMHMDTQAHTHTQGRNRIVRLKVSPVESQELMRHHELARPTEHRGLVHPEDSSFELFR